MTGRIEHEACGSALRSRLRDEECAAELTIRRLSVRCTDSFCFLRSAYTKALIPS